MTQEELKKLISKDETKNVELKKSTGELREGMHTACAFLNSDGGVLVFGVTPSLNIVGQIVSESTRRDIAQALAGIEPAVSPVIEYVDIPGKPNLQVIVLRFNPWVYGQKPYTFHGKPYYRLESVTKAMPRDMYDERLRQNFPHQFSWEMRVADKITIGDLDEKKIRGLVRLGVEERRISEESLSEPIEVVLEKWDLLDNGKVRNAAAFLFSRKKPIFYEIRLARFRGTDKNYFIDNQQAFGNFFELLDVGMGFFFKHLSLSGEIKGVMREEHLDVPVRALREALINALCHRDYDIHQCSIGIAIYDDRIEIESPGRLPHQLTPKTIKRVHKSFPLARLNGRNVTQNVTQNVAQNVTQNVIQNVTPNVTQDIEDGPRVQKVEQIILVDSMKTKEYLAKMFGVSTRTILRDLKKLGYAWEGASKNGHWVREKGRFVDANKTSVNKIEKEMKRIGK
jgi:ATP-dependent DNA helicase RecG